MDGAVLGPEAFVLRFFGVHNNDRLLAVNLGSNLRLDPAPEPLLALLEGMDWTILWSSEDPCYAGDGVTPLEDEDNWHLPGHTATVLRPRTRQG
jgi:maltooligosyltrehalose trehalohydrolase